MSQQINLYGPQFHPARDPLPAAWLLGIGAAALLLVAGLGVWNEIRLDRARQQAQASQQALAAGQAALAELARSAGSRRADPALAAALARAEALHQSRAELMDLLESGAIGTPGGFSDAMRGLARQSVAGLWLTAFDLSANEVELRGRALSAELVPAYLRRLGAEPALRGAALNALRIQQPVLPATAAGAPAEAPPPVFVEFVVASDAAALATPRALP